MRAIVRYTWILTEAIVWLITTSSLSSSSLPARNANMFNLTPSGSSSVLQIFPATKLFSDFLWAKMMFTHLSVFSHNKSVLVFLSLYSQNSTIFNFGFQRERKKWNASSIPLVAVKKTLAVRHATILTTTTRRRTRTVLRHVWLLSTRASLSCFRACGCDECGKGLLAHIYFA